MTLYVEQVSFSGPEFFGSVEIRKLGHLTVFFGKNGSGKSLVLRSWRDSDRTSVHYIAPERVGSFNFNPNLIQAELTPDGRSGAALSNIAMHYHDRALGRVASYLMKRGEDPQPHPDTAVSRIEDLLKDLLPGFQVKLQADDPPVVLTRTSETARVHSVDELSSGESQLLTLAIDLFTMAGMWALERSDKRILLIDEPDTHIHPDLQLRFAKLLRETAKIYSLQVVVATHSISLLAALTNVSSEGEVRLVYVQPNQRVLEGFPVDTIRRDLANCLGGHVLMGPLFGVPLLLVEGIDDYMVWSQAARGQAVSCAVLPCNGDEILRYQKRLEEIFAALQEEGDVPVAYALRDGDKALPVPNEQNRQAFVRFVQLKCHELENLYLTNEVLSALGWNDWKTASEEVARRSSSFGEKAERLSAAPGWERREVDLKGIISELATILDPKRVQWTTRLGSILGYSRPKGQLGALLGSELVDALWRE